MGRRKIDIQYLQDDRVRKVTFCKRKGGLFKKADDLAKLCGVEVAVIIVQENNKTCTYASTELDRVISRYSALSTNQPRATENETIDKLYRELELRRRELEDTQRLLLQERKKVEAFVGQDVQMLTVRPVDMTQMQQTGQPVQYQNGTQMQTLTTTSPTPNIQESVPVFTGGSNTGADDEDEDESQEDCLESEEATPSAKRQKIEPTPSPVAVTLN